MSQHSLSEALVGVFNRVFQAAEATILCGGAAEPYYEPGAPSVIYLTFAVSVDNLTVDAKSPEITYFKAAVDRQIMRFRQQGLPDRALRFKEALALLAAER